VNQRWCELEEVAPEIPGLSERVQSLLLGKSIIPLHKFCIGCICFLLCFHGKLKRRESVFLRGKNVIKE
jgi:hypothetical protein